MRRQEVQDNRHDSYAAAGPCSGDKAVQWGDVRHSELPRAYFAHHPVGAAIVAARRGNQALGVNRYERRDLPWIIALAVVVVVIAIFGIYAGGPAE